MVQWSSSSIPSRTALDLHRSPQPRVTRTPGRWHTLGPALLPLHHHLSVTAAEELSRDMKKVEVQGMVGIAGKCAVPEQPPPLHCMQSEQQAEGAALGTRTGTACLAPSCPSAQWQDFQVDCSKQPSRNRRARALLPLVCHIPSSSCSPAISLKERALLSQGQLSISHTNTMQTHGTLPGTVAVSTQALVY